MEKFLPSNPMENSRGQKLLLKSMHRNSITTNTHSVTPPFSRLLYAFVRSISLPAAQNAHIICYAQKEIKHQKSVLPTQPAPTRPNTMNTAAKVPASSLLWGFARK